MNNDEKPQLASCKEFETNQQVLEFIDIANDLTDISKLLKRAEADAAGNNTVYIFEFLSNIYMHSYKRLDLGDYFRFKYQMIYQTYNFQIDRTHCRIVMPSLLHEKTRENKKIIATYSFYYMIFFGLDETKAMLSKMGNETSTTLLNDFQRGSFLSIVSQIADLWYMPHLNIFFEVKETKEMNILRKFNEYVTLKYITTFDLKARDLLGIKIPVNDSRSYTISVPNQPNSQVTVKPKLVKRITAKQTQNFNFLLECVSSTPFKNREGSTLIAHKLNKEKEDDDERQPYIINAAVRAKITNTPRFIEKDPLIIEADESEDILNESVSVVNMSISERPELPRFQNYVCTSLLGSGAFSKVYGAVNTDKGNAKCAVKVLHFEKNQTMESVSNEIYLMKKMNESGKSVLLLDRLASH